MGSALAAFPLPAVAVKHPGTSSSVVAGAAGGDDVRGGARGLASPATIDTVPHELPTQTDVLVVGAGPAGSGAAAWAARHAADFSKRCEISGETAFCYTDDAAPLLAHLAHQPGLRTLHRPANLEDVFLKLTGRELRD